MYFNDVLSAGYIPTITLPTRLSTSSTLIDNIFTTNISKEVKACILTLHDPGGGGGFKNPPQFFCSHAFNFGAALLCVGDFSQKIV